MTLWHLISIQRPSCKVRRGSIQLHHQQSNSQDCLNRESYGMCILGCFTDISLTNQVADSQLADKTTRWQSTFYGVNAADFSVYIAFVVFKCTFFSLLGLGTSSFHAIILLHDILAIKLALGVAILTHRTSFLANNVSTAIAHYSLEWPVNLLSASWFVIIIIINIRLIMAWQNAGHT